MSRADRQQLIAMLLGCDPEHAEMVLAARDLAQQTSGEAFRKLTPVTAAPAVACFRAVAAGYSDLSFETLLVMAWCCFVLEREGKVPVAERVPFEWIGRGPCTQEADAAAAEQP